MNGKVGLPDGLSMIAEDVREDSSILGLEFHGTIPDGLNPLFGPLSGFISSNVAIDFHRSLGSRLGSVSGLSNLVTGSFPLASGSSCRGGKGSGYASRQVLIAADLESSVFGDRLLCGVLFALPKCE